MQVLLHADPHTDGRHQMAQHVETLVKDSLSRFGEQVTRVEAHLSDAISHVKTQPDEIHCAMEARLVGIEPVVVKGRAGNAHQAIRDAVTKLQRAVSTALAKREPRRHAGAPGDAQAGDVDDVA
jgi:hypothetical protein